jgi:hypothetical protein
LSRSVELGSFCRKSSVKLRSVFRIASAKMQKRNRSTKKLAIPLDRFSRKRGRGRPPRVRATEIRGRADNYRFIFGQVWDRLWPRLSLAMTDQEVIDAFLEGASPYAQEFVPALASLISRVLREPKFPKRPEAQINFLADSLAGLGYVAPRSSRDICQKERAREKRTHHIIRFEVYVECSCGFKGRSRNHTCPHCGAKIDFGFLDLRSL